MIRSSFRPMKVTHNGKVANAFWKPYFALSVAYKKGMKGIEGVREHTAEENIWT